MERENKKKDFLKYLSINDFDEKWGVAVTTVGYQFIPPQSPYPLSSHPDNYNFKNQNGRILNEYQLVYITKGSGTFRSEKCNDIQVKAGTMILLFPGEWHSYSPNENTGWNEYWVGFKGIHMDMYVKNSFFSKKDPLHIIGISSGIVALYDEIMKIATEERIGYQQMASSIVLHILGSIYYKEKNNSFTNSFVVDKINEARILMRNFDKFRTIEEIAQEIGVGYSWFRRVFKNYTGISPAQYQLQLRLLKAKELLTTTNINISEIAYILKFENNGQFSTFFKNKEGITPSQFRERNH